MHTNPGIHPLGKTLLLEVTPREKTLSSGIVLPTAVQGADTRMEAVIVERGPECEKDNLQVGTCVFVGKYASNDIPRGERRFRLANENEILAVLDEVNATFAPPVIEPIRPY